jgi:putative PEP-CTERM system TPR-repeat lipoprotein
MRPRHPRIRLLLLSALLAGAAVAAAPPDREGQAPAPAAPADSGASDLYEKALIEFNLGETRAAYIHLKNALLEDPFLLSAHLLLGKIYIQLGEGEKAEKELLIADGLGAHQSLTLIPLARAYLLQGKAEQLAAELFPLGSLAEEDAELLALRGQAYLQLEQLYDAQRSFAQAWERNPNNVTAILGRVHVLLMQGQLSEADFYARRAAELAPENPRAWFLKGTLSRGLGDLLSALQDFERAAEVLPAYLPAQIARVSVLLQLGRLVPALEVAEQAREIYPRDPRTAYLVAVVHGHRQDEAKAEQALRDAELLLSQLPKELIEGHAPTLLLAGMVAYSLKRTAVAQGYLKLFLRNYPDSIGPRILLGQMELDRGENAETIKLLEPAAALAPGDIKILSLLAEAYLKDGQHIKASDLLQQAMGAEEGNLVLRTQRAVNEFGLGRKAQAIEDLGAVVDAYPDLKMAGATLVVMSLKERRYAEAVVVSRRLLEGEPENLTYLNLFGVAETAAGNYEAARWAFELALALDWRFEQAQLNLAELELRAGRPEVARERLGLLMARNPDQEAGMLMLARSWDASGEHKKAREWAERAVGADPASVPVAVYLTDLLLRMKESEEALKVAESMEVRGPSVDDVDLLMALSRAYIANGQRATAQVVLQRGSSMAGYDAPMLMEIAALQRQAGDLTGALWSLEKAVSGQPLYLATRVKLGELYTELGKVDLARAVADDLRRDFPGDPYGDQMAGSIASAQGDAEQALASFTIALKRRPSPILAVRVYEAMREARGAEPALDFLTGWVREHPDDRIANQALAEALYRAGRSAEARHLYRRALEAAPDNPLLLNNLALIHAEQRSPEAVDLARKAYALLPGAAETADTLGWVLVQEGQPAEGLKLLREAKTRAVDDPGIGYHIAVALDGLGRSQEAFGELEAAFARGGSFPERERALELRRRLQGQVADPAGRRPRQPPAAVD